jgi:hypothetical protein
MRKRKIRKKGIMRAAQEEIGQKRRKLKDGEKDKRERMRQIISDRKEERKDRTEKKGAGRTEKEKTERMRKMIGDKNGKKQWKMTKDRIERKGTSKDEEEI